jgi:hypothetical protein
LSFLLTAERTASSPDISDANAVAAEPQVLRVFVHGSIKPDITVHPLAFAPEDVLLIRKYGNRIWVSDALNANSQQQP